MNKKAFQTAGSTLIIGLFLFFAFASTEETANTIRPESNSESMQNENSTIIYEQNCPKCNGYGEYRTEAPSGYVSKTTICEECNGTGKSSY